MTGVQTCALPIFFCIGFAFIYHVLCKPYFIEARRIANTCTLNKSDQLGKKPFSQRSVHGHTGQTVVAIGDHAHQLAVRRTVGGDGHGGVTVLLLEGYHVGQYSCHISSASAARRCRSSAVRTGSNAMLMELQPFADGGRACFPIVTRALRVCYKTFPSVLTVLAAAQCQVKAWDHRICSRQAARR